MQAVSEAEALLLHLLQTKDKEEKKLNEAIRLIIIVRNALQEKESELRQKVKSKEITDHLLNEIKDKLNELKLQLAGMKESLHVEFKIDLDEILDEKRLTDYPA